MGMIDGDDLPADGGNGASFDGAKARRAAGDPNRPGERCRAAPAAYAPSIDRSRCEGKAECVAVCPYDVFEVRRMDDSDFRALSFFSRLRSVAHRRMTAYTPRADQCRACGLCVVVCPENAISLVRSESLDRGMEWLRSR
jgi:NAD-dependent dihydropyrimidine dehydrogenase PreA subunit